jgi:MFS family permease
MNGSYAPRYTLFILMLTYSCNVMDRNILTMVLEPIRHEFALSDTQLGLLSGLSFAIFYAVAGLPLGLAADRLNRRNLIFVCLTLWSGMTALCGMAGSFVQLLVARIGVGVGEAGGGPPAMAMISDLFSAKRRATAISAFYLASPLGSLVSFAGGGWLAQHYGWRTAFYAAGVPGLILAAVLILTVREPPRGLSDVKSEATPAAAHKPSLRRLGRRYLVGLVLHPHPWLHPGRDRLVPRHGDGDRRAGRHIGGRGGGRLAGPARRPLALLGAGFGGADHRAADRA